MDEQEKRYISEHEKRIELFRFIMERMSADDAFDEFYDDREWNDDAGLIDEFYVREVGINPKVDVVSAYINNDDHTWMMQFDKYKSVVQNFATVVAGYDLLKGEYMKNMEDVYSPMLPYIGIGYFASENTARDALSELTEKSIGRAHSTPYKPISKIFISISSEQEDLLKEIFETATSWKHVCDLLNEQDMSLRLYPNVVNEIDKAKQDPYIYMIVPARKDIPCHDMVFQDVHKFFTKSNPFRKFGSIPNDMRVPKIDVAEPNFDKIPVELRDKSYDIAEILKAGATWEDIDTRLEEIGVSIQLYVDKKDEMHRGYVVVNGMKMLYPNNIEEVEGDYDKKKNYIPYCAAYRFGSSCGEQALQKRLGPRYIDNPRPDFLLHIQENISQENELQGKMPLEKMSSDKSESALDTRCEEMSIQEKTGGREGKFSGEIERDTLQDVLNRPVESIKITSHDAHERSSDAPYFDVFWPKYNAYITTFQYICGENGKLQNAQRGIHDNALRTIVKRGKYETQEWKRLDPKKDWKQINEMQSASILKTLQRVGALERAKKIEREISLRTIGNKPLPSFCEYLREINTNEAKLCYDVCILSEKKAVEDSYVFQEEVAKSIHLSSKNQGNGKVTYLYKSVPSFSDTSRKISVFDAREEDGAKQSLLFSRMKFGNDLHLGGSMEFKELMLKHAVDLGVNITNQELQQKQKELQAIRATVVATKKEQQMLNEEKIRVDSQQTRITIHKILMSQDETITTKDKDSIVDDIIAKTLADVLSEENTVHIAIPEQIDFTGVLKNTYTLESHPKARTYAAFETDDNELVLVPVEVGQGAEMRNDLNVRYTLKGSKQGVTVQSEQPHQQQANHII